MFQYIRAALIAIAFWSTAPLDAQAISLGEFEYKNSCIQCHGPSGKGDGPLAAHLKKPPSDLTLLQKGNGGVFPVERTFSAIEGTADVPVHGPRDMPIWGDRFRERTQAGSDGGFPSSKEIDAYARIRILAVIEYLSTLQAK